MVDIVKEKQTQEQERVQSHFSPWYIDASLKITEILIETQKSMHLNYTLTFPDIIYTILVCPM